MALTPTKENTSPSRSGFPLKRWIWVPLALILALLIILSQIDLESVKEKLIERISRDTGLKVEIDSMGFGFSHGLGLKCNGVKVITPEGKHFSVDQLHLLAEWGSLLQGKFKIKSAALIHPEAELEIFKPSPLPGPGEKPSEEPQPQAGLIGPETLRSATSKLNSTGLSIEELIISDGKVTLIRSGTPEQLSLNIDGAFILNRFSGEHLGISASAVKLQTGSIIFEGEGKVLTAENAGISLNVKSNSFSWQEIQPVLHFLGDPTKEAPLKSVDVDQLLIKADIPLNSLSQIETLQKQMTGQVELKIRNADLKMGDKNYFIEALAGEATWENGVLAHNFSGTALGSDFSLNGKLPLFNPEQEAASRVEWKNLGLEKLPIKKGLAWNPTQGKVSGSLSFTGPLPNEKEMFPGRLKGAVEFQAEDLVFKSADSNEARPIEVSHLKGSGDFSQGQLQHEIHGTVWASDFDIKGILQLNKDKPVLNSRINWKGLDLSQLPLTNTGWHPVEGKLSGTLTLAGPAHIAGENFPGGLKGSLQFDAQNLKMQSKDLPFITFNQLKGSGDIENHQVTYKINGDPFNGTFNSDGTIILSASGSSPPVLNNKIEFANLDLSQIPMQTTKGIVSGSIKLNGPLPEAENLLTSNLKIDTSFKVANLKMSVDALPIDIQQLEGRGTLKKGQLTHDLNGTLFGGKVKAKGILTFQENKEQTLITANSDLVLDKVSLNWVPLVHQSEWSPTSGTVTGNLKIKGPLPSEGKISPALKLKGILKGEKLVLGNPEKQVENAKLEFKESSSTLTQVQVDLERIKLGDRSYKKAIGIFQISPEKIDLTGGQLWPLNGLINLVGNFQPQSGNYRLKFKGEKLKVEEFLPSKITGPLQFSGALEGALPQNTDTPGLPDYSRDLSGDIKIELIDGALPELGALENLLTLLNPTTVLNAKKGGLSYDYLGGDFKIVKGVVNTQNLEMKGPQIMLNAEGQANLVEDSITAQVKAMPLQMLDKTLKAIPLLGQILTGGKKGGVIETHFKVHGKLSQPDFTLQAHKSLTEKPGSILNELLKLGK